MFGLIKKIFLELITSLVNVYYHTKCIVLSIQKFMIQPTLINLHPTAYSQKSLYYPFPVELDRSVGSCNTLNGLFNKVYVPNKTEDLNISMFNMIKGKNE